MGNRVLTPEQWRRLSGLFQAALERPSDERFRFLDENCAGEDERREVEALLAQHELDPEFLEREIVEAWHRLDLAHETRSLVGRRIRHYELRTEIGRGGMGVVYLAEDLRLGRRVAVKVLPPEFARDPQRRQRLVREARAAAAVVHPNVATVFGLEEEGDELCVVSEFVDGETLRAEIDRGPLPRPRWCGLACDLARGLEAAHAQGVVHRDLKPENVLITRQGVVKIVDFGLARFDDRAGAEAGTRADAGHAAPSMLLVRTAPGVVLGTPAYMSPEQIGGRPVDFRSDLFSLGVVLSEAATGRHPFADRSLTSTLARILEEDTEPLSIALGPDWAGLDRVLDRLLRKDAALRYGRTADVVRDLESARAAAATRPSGVAAAHRQDPGVPLASRWWWEVHQLIRAGVSSLTLILLWLVRHWLGPPWVGRAVFGVALVAGVIVVTLRLHLAFVSRYEPGGLAGQRRRVRWWVRGGDAAFLVLALLASLLIFDQHTGPATVLLIIALASAVGHLVIEPATERAAFESVERSP
jgi:eukaryotic-like serine/threonine-protein kinase